jgi:hypothetical protein
MTLGTKCFRCGSRRLVHGSIPGRHGGDGAFHPMDARLGPVRAGVPLPSDLVACANCGLFVGELSVSALSDELAWFANAEVKAWLAEKPDRPL